MHNAMESRSSFAYCIPHGRRRACDEVRGGRRFHHGDTESTKICKGEEGLLERLSAFFRVWKLLEDGCIGTRRAATPEPPESVSSGNPNENFVLSVSLW